MASTYPKLMECPFLSDAKRSALARRLKEEDFEENDLLTASEEIIKLLCPTLGLRLAALQFINWVTTGVPITAVAPRRPPSAVSFDLSKVDLDSRVLEELQEDALCTQYRELVHVLADSLLQQNPSGIRFDQPAYRLVTDTIRQTYPNFLTRLDWHQSRFQRDLAKCVQNLRFRKRKAPLSLVVEEIGTRAKKTDNKQLKRHLPQVFPSPVNLASISSSNKQHQQTKKSRGRPIAPHLLQQFATISTSNSNAATSSTSIGEKQLAVFPTSTTPPMMNDNNSPSSSGFIDIK